MCSKYCTRRAAATCLDLKRSAPMLVPNHTHVLIWYGDIHGPEPDKSMQYRRGPQYCTCLQAKTIAHVIWARGVWGGGGALRVGGGGLGPPQGSCITVCSIMHQPLNDHAFYCSFLRVVDASEDAGGKNK